MVMGNLLSYIIVGINYIIRTIMIMLLSWIGYSSETDKLTKITTFTFYMLFFNTAFLLMLVNADLSEQPVNFGLTGGQYGDFNALWWKQIGNALLSTMFINAIFPLLEFGMYFGMRFLPRCIDRGWKLTSKSRYDPPTKTTTIMGYVDLYAGPEF